MTTFKCTRCNHQWYPRNYDAAGNPVAPVVCPRCHSPYWRTERIEKKDKEVKDHE